jgi:hypothetical protein
MDLRKKAKESTRWVYPVEADPEFGVEVRQLSDAESSRIMDKAKYFPLNDRMATMGKLNTVIKDTIIARVVSWSGVNDPETHAEMPCTDANKLLLLDATVEDAETGEKTSLWLVIAKKFDADREEEEKNSQTPPSIFTAATQKTV